MFQGGGQSALTKFHGWFSEPKDKIVNRSLYCALVEVLEVVTRACLKNVSSLLGCKVCRKIRASLA